jgi:hypothetical protein
VPPRIRAAIEGALKPDRNQRIASCEQLKRVLEGKEQESIPPQLEPPVLDWLIDTMTPKPTPITSHDTTIFLVIVGLNALLTSTLVVGGLWYWLSEQ